MANTSETYTYGNQPEFEFETLRLAENNSITSGSAVAERASISRDAFFDALDDTNRTLTVLEDTLTGKTFEVAMANVGATSGIADAEISTFSSSITGNIGNATEFAEHSALHPENTRVYIASIGNGGSSYWDESERKYITKTGRFTAEDGEPLPTVAALERVLRTVGGLTIGRLSTNSAGGAFATALMSAMPEGQVTHSYLKSRPNISNHPTRLLWGAGLMLSEQYDSPQYKANTEDEWGIDTDKVKEEARPYLEAIYGHKNGKDEWTAKGATTEKGIKRLYWDMLAFSKGGAKYGHPAAADTRNALAKQPGAQLTYHFPEKDRLYSDLRRDVGSFLQHIGIASSQVEAVLMPGTHHDHSQYPSLRWSIEKYAFNK